MRSSLALFTLCLLLLFAKTLNARKDIGEYWKGVVNDQPMPEAIQGLVRSNPTISSNDKTDCHTADHKKIKNFIRDFDEEPNVSVYDNKIQPKTKEKHFVKDLEARHGVMAAYVDGALDGEKSFAHDFEPRPSATNYDTSVVKGEKYFSKDFEPRLSVTIYDNDVLKGEKSFSTNFEPRPSATSYDNSIVEGEKSLSKDFEPRPSATTYDNSIFTGEKSFSKDFEPRLSVTIYDNSALKEEKSFSSDSEPGNNASVYDNGASLKENKQFSDDFESRPSVTGVHSGSEIKAACIKQASYSSCIKN